MFTLIIEGDHIQLEDTANDIARHLRETADKIQRDGVSAEKGSAGRLKSSSGERIGFWRLDPVPES